MVTAHIFIIKIINYIIWCLIVMTFLSDWQLGRRSKYQYIVCALLQRPVPIDYSSPEQLSLVHELMKANVV